ncbi:MAG: hypothetical protein HN509_02235 [Halobacteriovoraceae bacterium]|jgi:predicted ATP-grasp superfamily ATP-dependent carboligase|nr:hypothetical protein [Halobacteriovoraceae bacterium]MBT5093695.1 hypothetical protein [Halobacteriovoraceae bacterium]
MLKQLLILTENSDLYSNLRWKEECFSLNLELSFRNPYLRPAGAPFKGPTLLRTTGFRYDDSDLENYALSQSIYNTISISKALRDKWSQALLFKKLSLPSPRCWRIEERPYGHNQLVLKTLRGSKGIGVELLDGARNIETRLFELEEKKDSNYLLQEYIKNFREFRVLYSFGEVIGVLEKLPNSEDFRRNASLHPDYCRPLRFEQLPDPIIKLLVSTVSKLNFHLVGIDLILEQEEASLLEINLVPGFKQLEVATGKNIAQVILKQMIEKCRWNFD